MRKNKKEGKRQFKLSKEDAVKIVLGIIMIAIALFIAYNTTNLAG